jgi:hypothetical protein
MRRVFEPDEFSAFQSTARTIGCHKNFDGQVVVNIHSSGWRFSLNRHKKLAKGKVNYLRRGHTHQIFLGPPKN